MTTIGVAIINWQNWRNAQYTELCEERRRVANLQRHDAQRAERNPIYSGSTRVAEESDLDESERRYARICAMDAQLKALYRAGNEAIDTYYEASLAAAKAYVTKGEACEWDRAEKSLAQALLPLPDDGAQGR